MPSKPKPAAVKSAVSALKSKPAARGPPAKPKARGPPPKPSSAAKAGVSFIITDVTSFLFHH